MDDTEKAGKKAAKKVKERAKRTAKQRQRVLDLIVERSHQALVSAVGTANAPDPAYLRQQIEWVMEYVDHPDYADQEYFTTSSGAVLHVQRDHRFWHTVQVLVPATGQMCWYLNEKPTPAKKES